MQAYSFLTLNTAAPNAAMVAYAVQNDKLSRYVIADLVDGDQALTPPPNASYAIRYVKPDKTGGFYDTLEDGSPAIVADGNRLTIGYASQVLTVPGDVFVQLQILSGSGSVLTTFAWVLKVFPNVWTDEEVESSDYYSILSQQIAAVLDAAESLTGMTASASQLPSGSDPTVTVTGGEGGVPYNLAFGIPLGPPGPAPTISSVEILYQQGSSGTTPPTGTWQETPPAAAQGSYLWTRVIINFNSGQAGPFYSVAYRGQDGSTVGYVDDASARADITVSGNYARLDPPSLPSGAKIISVGANYSSISGVFSILPYIDGSRAYLYAENGTVIKGLQCRFWYVI